MNCDFCNNKFSNKQNLNSHQRKAKYCLKIQGFETSDIKCDICEQMYSGYVYKKHINICEKRKIEKEVKILNTELNKQVDILTMELGKSQKEVEILTTELEKSQKRNHELSLIAIKRPSTSNKNIRINNYIKNMPPILDSDITDNVKNLTLEHHVEGAEGYSKYAMQHPFKDRIACVDVTRGKIKYKDENGNVIEDAGFGKMMTKLCDALKERSFMLCQEHYENLSKKYTEKELEKFDFMETAIAIAKCSEGHETDFCNKIIKMISKGSTVS